MKGSVFSIDGRPLALLLFDRMVRDAGKNRGRTRRTRHPMGGDRGQAKRDMREAHIKAVKAQQIIEKEFLQHVGMPWREIEKQLRDDPILKGFRGLHMLAERHGLVAKPQRKEAA